MRQLLKLIVDWLGGPEEALNGAAFLFLLLLCAWGIPLIACIFER